MTMGEKLNERMQLLGIGIPALSEASFVEKDMIQDLLENRRSHEMIDLFDRDLICSALSCDPSYFTDDGVREKDLLIATRRRKDSVTSRKVKAKLQDFMRNWSFVTRITKIERK